jgi:hypothetical protein
LYWFIAEITTIASSTRSQSDKIKANIDREFRVNPYQDIAKNVTRSTKGTEVQAIRASLSQIIAKSVIKTSKIVNIPSLTK